MGNLKQFADAFNSKITSKIGGKFRLSDLKQKFKKNSKKKPRSLTAIEINERGFAVVEVTFAGDQCRVLNCQFVHNTNPNIRSELISELIQRREIDTTDTKIVISGSAYKFLLAEAPNAPLEGLRAIMPSKIKDSLPWKLSEITSDVLQLPPDAFRGRKKSVYVAVVNNAHVEEQVDMLKTIKIEPTSITTMEMAIKAYWSLLKVPAKTSLGILRITEHGGVIVMVCDGSIYLARRMVVALDSLSEEGVSKQDVFDQVVLEIQRSVDFYESQLGKGPVSKIVLLPPPIDLGLGFEYIEQNISTDIELTRPLDLLEYKHDLSLRDEAYCIGALGVALEGFDRA